MKKVAVIGGGFSGLAAACYTAQKGYQVTVFEKNPTMGGRGRVMSEQGFVFDMGPSWYWMPDIFERFFKDFNHTAADFFELLKLDPGFQIFFGKGEKLELPASLGAIYELFESIEKGSADKLRKFLKEGERKYRIGMLDMAYKPSMSLREFVNPSVISNLFRTDLFRPMESYVRKFFKDERLIRLMEFPVLFLGAMPSDIPALYSLMNYSAISQGTFYPQGGMHKIVEAMTKIAEGLDVELRCAQTVNRIGTTGDKVTHLLSNERSYHADAIVAAADYHHVEKYLLQEERLRNYPDNYWQKKTFAPSCLIYYVGVSRKISGLLHHNLFFDTNFDIHSAEIYDHPQWPSDPLFYVCCPSKTDPSVAPEGMENLFILVPVASGLPDSEAIRESYFLKLIHRMEKETGDKFEGEIIFKKSYSVKNFISDYNSYKGNAYGLANTLRQTAFLKPRINNKQLKNLFYAGQLTVPGPGVPPALISGKIAAAQTDHYLRKI